MASSSRRPSWHLGLPGHPRDSFHQPIGHNKLHIIYLLWSNSIQEEAVSALSVILLPFHTILGDLQKSALYLPKSQSIFCLEVCSVFQGSVPNISSFHCSLVRSKCCPPSSFFYRMSQMALLRAREGGDGR